VYSNVNVLPAEPATAVVGETAIEPEPSAATLLNVAVTDWEEFPMLNLHVPSVNVSVQAVIPLVGGPLQPAKWRSQPPRRERSYVIVPRDSLQFLYRCCCFRAVSCR